MTSSTGWDSRPFRGIVLVVLVGLMLPSYAMADYRSSYRDGIQALDRRQWAAVVQHMRQAIAEQPQAGEQLKIYGLRFESYVPHYYLAMALHELDDCAGAIPAWSTALEQGALSTAQRRDVAQRKSSCPQDVSKPPPPDPPPAEPAIDPAELRRAEEQAAAALTVAEVQFDGASRLRQAAAFAELWRREPGLLQQISAAELNLGNARRAIAEARGAGDLAALGRAAELARDVERAVVELQEQIERRAAELSEEAEFARRRQSLRSQLAATAAEGRQLLATGGAEDPRLSARRIALQVVLGEIETVNERSGEAELRQRQERLGVALRSLSSAIDDLPEPVADPVLPPAAAEVLPTELRAAATAFFEAEYRRVLELLPAPSFRSTRARATAHLLRAAAAFALHRQGSAKQEVFRQAATEPGSAVCNRPLSRSE